MSKRNPKPPPEDLIARDKRVDEALVAAAKKPQIKLPKPEVEDVSGDDLKCSFCGKPRTECFVLITGPKVAICGDCAKDAYACLLDARQNRAEKPVELRLPPAPPPTKPCHQEDRIAKLEETTENLKVRLEALEEEERSR